VTPPPDNLAFHAQHPSGGEGYVVLLFRPTAGRVGYREWSSTAYLEPGRDCSAPVDEVVERVRAWARDGWKLTESPERISAWLRAG
jgi:hypothetical protein